MKFRLTILFFILGFFINAFSFAQDERGKKFLEDSIKIARPKPIRPQFKFDTRTTVYENQKLNMFGYDAGILVRDKLRLTIGYYRIDDELPQHTELNSLEMKQTIYVRCGTINSELVYLKKRFFSLGFPLEIGLGYYRLKQFSVLDGMEFARLEGAVAFSNFGLAGTFTPIRWFGLKAMVGYRKAILSSNKQFDFNGVFSSIGLNLDVQEIIRDFKMYRLQKRYHKPNFRRLESFTDLMID